MRFDRAVLCTSLLLCAMSGCAASHRVKGPDFEVWDFKYGRIEGEDFEWVVKAQAEGRLDNRELSCRVVKRRTALRFPFDGQFPRYGFTFEYATSRPDLPVELYVVYPDRYSPTTIGPIRQRGTQRYRLRGTWGRFCVWESGAHVVQFPGRYWYRLAVDGVHVKDWYVDLLNGDAALPESSHTKAVLDEPGLAPPAQPAPSVMKGPRYRWSTRSSRTPYDSSSSSSDPRSVLRASRSRRHDCAAGAGAGRWAQNPAAAPHTPLSFEHDRQPVANDALTVNGETYRVPAQNGRP